MPCVHEKEYYDLMKLKKHHHLEFIKEHLKEGEVISKEFVLEKAQDLDEGDSVDDEEFIFDMTLFEGTK